MKGWVLGITGVFCLQAGFIALTAIDRPFETIVAVNAVVSDSIPIADTVVGSADADEVIYYDSEPGMDAFRIESVAVSTAAKRKNRRFVPNPRTGKRFVKLPEPQTVNFEPVIIAVRKHPPIEFKTEYARVEPVAQPSDAKQQPVEARPVFRPKSKSLASKSLAVIKKPYDWLKALGSKFK